jgi:hypothetical protein
MWACAPCRRDARQGRAETAVPFLMSQLASRSSSRMRDQTSGTRSEMSWSTCGPRVSAYWLLREGIRCKALARSSAGGTCLLGPMTPAEEMKTCAFMRE